MFFKLPVKFQENLKIHQDLKRFPQDLLLRFGVKKFLLNYIGFMNKNRENLCLLVFICCILTAVIATFKDTFNLKVYLRLC